MNDPIDLDALRDVVPALREIDRDDLENVVTASLAELTARRARDAEVAELVAADLELDRAIEAASGFVAEGYEPDSYGVHGSDFERCLACGAESGAGVLNKGVTHEADCVRHRYEVALERRAAALLPFQRSDDKGDAT